MLEEIELTATIADANAIASILEVVQATDSLLKLTAENGLCGTPRGVLVGSVALVRR